MNQTETTYKIEGAPGAQTVSSLMLLVLTLKKQVQAAEEQQQSYRVEIDILRGRVDNLTRQLFGRKSEKYILDEGFGQRSLFEPPGESEANEAVIDEKEETITVSTHARKKGGRKPLPPDLPRYEVIHDLDDKGKQCPCGCEKTKNGEEVTEKLEMLPPQMWVVRHVRYKYACKSCEGVESAGGAVQIAPAPAQIIPKSIATPSLLAHVFVSKFADALPFYRQEKLFLRYGIELNRSKMCHWAFHVSNKLKKLLEMLLMELGRGPYLSMDETTVQVLKEPDREASNKSYMWLIRGGPPGKKIVIFHYSPSRGREVAKELIGDFQGYVQTDGYGSYDFLDLREGLIHVGCWAHARRKFVEVVRLAKSLKGTEAKHGKAAYALGMIGQLYRIEKQARKDKLSPQDVYRLRQDQARPVVKEFKEWLDSHAMNVAPKSLLGKAFHYTLHQWPRLVNYLESGIIPIDNNLTENAIRPFVVGRKNWLFSDQPRGAEASALFYSLIETAKQNGLEPYAYFLYLFDRLPHAVTEDDWKQLMPIYIAPERLREFKREYWMKFDENSGPQKN